MVLFSTAVGMFSELIVAGLTLQQSLQARALAVPVNLLSGRPYGWFRDAWFKLLKIHSKGTWAALAADTSAFVLFQTPLYAAILLSSGANLQQVILACSSVVGLLLISGRPFGYLLDLSRRMFAANNAATTDSESSTLR